MLKYIILYFEWSEQINWLYIQLNKIKQIDID